MPKKAKKKVGKKSTKKVAVKKTAKKKAAKKAASRPVKKKSAASSVKAIRRTPKGTPTTRTPKICADSFSGNNGDPVQFQAIPAIGVRITQVGTTYPFLPVTGTLNGVSYTEVAVGGQITISASPSTTPYSYAVNCSCPGLEGTHSVTVNS
jgi:hypothetical protein